MSSGSFRHGERLWRWFLAAAALAVVFLLATADGGRNVDSLILAQSTVFLTLAVAIAAGTTRGVPLSASIPMMIGAVAVTAITSVRPEASVHELLLWGMYAGIGTLAAAGLRDSCEWFVDGLVLTAGCLCLIALFWFWGSGDLAARWCSTFYWPNPFAAFLLLVLPLSLVRAVRAPNARSALAHGAAAVLFGVALAFTYSRGAWLAGGMVLLAAVAVLRPRRWRTAVFRSALIVLAVAGAVGLLGRAARSGAPSAVASRAASLADPEDASVHGRRLFWRGALEIFADHPVLGTGPGTFGAAYSAYQREAGAYARDPHNLYLQAAAEMGVVGLAALLTLLVSMGLVWRRLLRRARDEEEYSLVAGIGLGLLAFLLHNAVDMDWSFPAIPAMAFAFAGVLTRIGMAQRPEETPARAGIWLRSGVVVLLLAALVAVQCMGQANRSFRQGQTFADAGSWDDAAAACARAHRWSPLQARYLSAEAQARVRMVPQQRVRAEAALREAMRLDPMNSLHLLHLADLLAPAPGAGPIAFREPVALLRRALVLDPFNRPRLYRSLAGLQLRLGRPADAKSVYDAAVGRYLGYAQGGGAAPLSPETLDLLAEVAEFRLSTGDTTGAERVRQALGVAGD